MSAIEASGETAFFYVPLDSQGYPKWWKTLKIDTEQDAYEHAESERKMWGDMDGGYLIYKAELIRKVEGPGKSD